MTHSPKSLLKEVFGYDHFRTPQEEIIENILKRRDSLVIMPTGGGKSLCYQIPALLFKGLTLVVSPLISLMEDQVRQLSALGVEAVFLNSSLSYEAYQDNITRIRSNEVRLVYLAPETLLMQKTLDLLSSQQVDCLTIDEAHCISEWGHDFRPGYRQLIEVRKVFPEAVCVALTATATPRVQTDIQASLNFEDSDAFLASFNRKNLFLQITPKTDPLSQTLEFLKKFKSQSGIIYCFSRRQVDGLTEFLENQEFSVKAYHAGLSDRERYQNQELFIRDDIQIMVATIAFGMGINKPNIRFVVHYDLPQNIESYYQQIGRAGRDGLKAHCLLLFGYADIQKIKYFMLQKEESEQRIAVAHLNSLIAFAESDECRRIPLLGYFGEEITEESCAMCDNCLAEPPTLINVSISAQKFLSCVKRSGERFGAGYIIDILRGSQSQKIKNNQHQHLSTYGIGKETSKKQWFAWSRQWIQKGLLLQDLEFGSLKLTEKSWQVLKGKLEVFAKEEEIRENKSQASQKESNLEKLFNRPLFDRLRQCRKDLADECNVPPYVIFPDQSLMEMATYFPQSQTALLQLHGVGSIKLREYGSAFLELIEAYCQEHDLEEKPKHSPASLHQSDSMGFRKHMTQRKYEAVGESYNSGKSLSELQDDFKVTRNTILKHLFDYHTEGNSLRYSNECLELSSLCTEEQNAVLERFAELGTLQLRPVFDAFKEQVSYEDLRLLRFHALLEK